MTKSGLPGPVIFLWGYAMSRVYANKPVTIQQMKAEIIRVIADVTPDICERVIGNFIERVNWPTQWKWS